MFVYVCVCVCMSVCVWEYLCVPLYVGKFMLVYWFNKYVLLVYSLVCMCVVGYDDCHR